MLVVVVDVCESGDEGDRGDRGAIEIILLDCNLTSDLVLEITYSVNGGCSGGC